MLSKIIVFQIFFVILNPVIKLNASSLPADNSQTQARVGTLTEAENMWQPIIVHNSKWLTAPSTLTPTLQLSSAEPSSASASTLRQSVNFQTMKPTHRGSVSLQAHYNNTNHYDNPPYSDNYNTTHLTNSTPAVTLSSSQSPSSTLQTETIKNMKFNSQSNIMNIVVRDRRKLHLNSPKYQHEAQKQTHQLVSLKSLETPHSHIQKPQVVTSQVKEKEQHLPQPLMSHYLKHKRNRISSQLNLHHLETVAERQLPTPQKRSISLSTYWQYDPKASKDKNKIMSETSETETKKNLNLKTKTIGNNNDNEVIVRETLEIPSQILLTKKQNSFEPNKNLMDTKVTNTQNNQEDYRSHQLNSEFNPSNPTLKAFEDNETLTKASISLINNNEQENFRENLLLLRNTLNSVQEFFENIKDIIWYRMDDNVNRRSDDDNDDNHDYDEDDYFDNTYDILYSNDDEASEDDNDLQTENSSPLQVAKTVSTTTAAMDKIYSRNMKNILLASSSAQDEVQGRKRQIDKGTTSTTTINLLSPLDPSKTLNVAEATAMNGNETQTKVRLWNSSNKVQTVSASSSLPATTTSKAASLYSSGRKLTKVPKKFKKFMLPLLLAYKLKFMALIPLLIGGLVLLVGTTGLAGFFFALFTAVMSLKSSGGGRNAIVVKKYR